MRRLVLVFALILVACSCLAEEPASAPSWAGIRHERAGWTLRIVNVERRTSVNLTDVLGTSTKGIVGTVSPPPGTEYLVVSLSGEAAEGAAEISFAKIAVIDASGLRHESMLTHLVLNAAKKIQLIPTPVPVGSDIRAFELDGLRWPLLTGAPAPAETK